MRGSTHIHTHHSWDSRMSPRRLAQRLQGAGIELALVTDHDSFAGAVDVQRLMMGVDPPVRVPLAAEIRTELGDVIVVLDDGEVPPVHELKSWRGLQRRVRDVGGLIWLPHPLRSHRDVEELVAGSDVVEIFNARCSASQNQLAADLCLRFEKVPAYGSDAHLLREAATWWVEYEDRGSVLDTLRGPPRCSDARFARRSDVDVAEIVNGVKRGRPALVGYFALRYLRDRGRDLWNRG